MSELIPKHGGYRKLKSFQVARLIYDVTVRFCDRYIDKFSRTRDQMVRGTVGRAEHCRGLAGLGDLEENRTQADSGTGSLEELKLDYEDFLRQRGMVELKPNHMLMRQERKPQTVEAFAAWVNEERKKIRDRQGRHGQAETAGMTTRPCRSVQVRASPCPPLVWRPTARFHC